MPQLLPKASYAIVLANGHYFRHYFVPNHRCGGIMYIEHGISNLGHMQVIGIWQCEREPDMDCKNIDAVLIVSETFGEN